MMDLIVRLAGAWGVADSVWLAVAPGSWARFWGRWIDRAEAGGAFPRALAAAECAISLYFLFGWRRGRRPGR
ncbi:MAG TPA: hypothetical protein VK066_01650 [Chloroflexota bacterium]|nr:hypothetical protein [Chloroflexota bacterium]